MQGLLIQIQHKVQPDNHHVSRGGGVGAFVAGTNLRAYLSGIVILSPARGGIFTLMHAHLLGELPDSTRDLLYGIYMVIRMIAGSTDPLVVGFLVDRFRFGFCDGFLFLTILLALVIPLTYLLIDQNE